MHLSLSQAEFGQGQDGDPTDAERTRLTTRKDSVILDLNPQGHFQFYVKGGVNQLQLVQCYRHLGGAMHHTADQAREINQRAATAHAAMNQHRRLVYQNVALAIDKRKELFDMLVMSKIHVWIRIHRWRWRWTSAQ